ASANRMMNASEDRRPHIWPESSIDRDPDDRAGGAEFGHIALERQRALKAEVLIDSLRRFGGLDYDAISAATGGTGVVVEAAPGDDQANGLGWRTRMRLHVDDESGRAGPYAARGRRVILVEALPLGNEQIGHLAPLD